jgi:hypothetical protein
MREKMAKSQILRVFGLLALLWGNLIAPAQAQSPGPNLLANAGFDEPWSKRYDRCKNVVLEEVQVPAGWDPYYACQSSGDAPNINRTPEYRMVNSTQFPDRVHGGPTALRYFNFWALNRSAGVFQMVNNITPGARLRFSMWVQLWTSNVDSQPPTSQVEPGNLEARLCIDQDGGGWDLADPNVVCSAWARPWDQYQELSVEGTALSGQVIVALQTRAEFPVKHNDVQADDAALVVIGRGSVPAQGGANASGRIVPAVQVTAPAGAVPKLAVRSPVVNLRAAPSMAAKILGQAKQGDVLDVKGRSADRLWWQVSYRSGLAWVMGSITIANAAANGVPMINVPVPQVKVTPSKVTPKTSPRVTPGPVLTPEVPGVPKRW